MNDQREHPSSSTPLILASDGGACPGFSSGTDVTDVTDATDIACGQRGGSPLGFHEGSGVTGMMVTVRVADSGVCGTFPKAKPLLARRRRRKI